MGDAYVGSSATGGTNSIQGAPRRLAVMHKQAPTTLSGLKPKDLIGLPWRLAFALQADGWWLRSPVIEEVEFYCPCGCGHIMEERVWRYAQDREIIWKKPNPMPESVTDRPTTAHEHVFLLAKSARYFYDAEAIREQGTSGPSDLRKMDKSLERIGGKHKNLVDPLARASSATNIGRKRAVGSAMRNRRSVWTIATEPYSETHFATFPQKLVEPCILAGTSERGCCPECGAPWERAVNRQFRPQGDVSAEQGIRGHDRQKPMDAQSGWQGFPRGTTDVIATGWRPTCDHDTEPPVPCVVIDRFAGSGTVGLVAQRLGRRWLACDISAEYAELARTRCQEATLPMALPA